jgi:signal transduction histidine kinase
VPRVFEVPNQSEIFDPRYSQMLNERGIKTLLIVPLTLGEQNLGFLELHFPSTIHFTSDDLELAQALGNHATLALQLSRLTRRAEQLAVTEERNRLARDIHDTLAQAFAGIVLHSEALGTSLGVSKQRSAKSLSRIHTLARSGLDEARRSVQALRPKALEGSTLSEALRQVARRLAEGGGLACHFRQRGEAQTLSLEAQNELFRVAQEALTNVHKHAQAKSVWINLAFTARQVSLTIRDNGVGLAGSASADTARGYGLGTMRERAQRIGGQLEIENPKTGGTSVRVRVPLTKTGKSKQL